MKLHFILLAITAVVLAACSPGYNKEQMAKADSLLGHLDNVTTKLESMDTVIVDKYYRTANEALKFIQDNYTDTMEKEAGFLLSDYQVTRKSLRRLRETYIEEVDMLEYSRKQLSDLKTDIKNNLLTEEHFNEYFNAESEAVSRLIESIENMSSWHQSTIKKFEERNPKVQKIVEELKQKQK